MTRFASTYFHLDAPYRWLCGNHHGHSTVSDGRSEPIEIVRAYEAEGYHYLALSEHDRLLDPAELQPHTTMCILPAVEVTSRFGQTLLYLGGGPRTACGAVGAERDYGARPRRRGAVHL